MWGLKPKWHTYFNETYSGRPITRHLFWKISEDVARILIEEGVVDPPCDVKTLRYSILIILVPMGPIMIYGLTPELNRIIQDFFFEGEDTNENQS